VCELSLPHDVSRRVALERPDVLVVEGGNMRVPVRSGPNACANREPISTSRSRPNGACLHVGDDVLALENRCESYTLGRGVDLEKVREIDALAERAGFELATCARSTKRSPRSHRRHRAAADARRAALA